MRLVKPTLLAPVVGLLALTGCASGSSDNSTISAPSGGASAGASAGAAGGASDPKSLVPADIAKAGVIRAATDGTYPPNEFTGSDGKTLQGFDIDLGNAVAQRLGLKIEFANAKFDSILTGIQGNRYDLSLSSFTDNKERQAKVDFVDYFTAGTSILVKKGNPNAIKTLDDLCGKTIAIQRGTTQDDVAKAQQAKCKTTGKELKVLKFDRDTEALLQLKQGRAVADMNDFPVAAYTTQQAPDSYEVVGEQIAAGPYGIGIRKEDSQIRDALQKAVQALIASGEYTKILQKWKVTQGAVATASVNGGS